MARLSHGALPPRPERVCGCKVDGGLCETYQQSSGRAPGRPVGKWTEGDVMEPIAAVVLAAGKGTRMKSDKAKVLHQALGRPLAYFPVRAAFSLDCAPVIAVVGHQAQTVEQELSQLFPGAPLEFALQAEQLGTGHAVMSAQVALRKAGFSDKGSVLLLCGDTPLVTAETLQRLVKAKEASGAPLALVTTRPADPKGYGRIVRNEKGGVERIVEEKDASAAERKIG